MPRYNLSEYSDIYSKTSGCLQQYYRDEAALNKNNVFIHFSADDNNSILFKLKQKITGQTNKDGIKDVNIMVPLKYLSTFWRMLECH